MKVFLATIMALGIVFILEGNQSLKAAPFQPIKPPDHQSRILLAQYHGYGGGYWGGGRRYQGRGTWINTPHYYGPSYSYPYEDPYNRNLNIRVGPLELIN